MCKTTFKNVETLIVLEKNELNMVFYDKNASTELSGREEKKIF